MLTLISKADTDHRKCIKHIGFRLSFSYAASNQPNQAKYSASFDNVDVTKKKTKHSYGTCSLQITEHTIIQTTSIIA